MVEGATGYLHPSYAEALAELGTPLELPRSAGWILKRQIPGSPHFDAMGCYPLFACRDWSQLGADLDDLGNDLVSLSAVSDPFGGYDVARLQQCFGDVVRPYKQHFVVDLSRPMGTIVSNHHWRYSQKALGNVDVRECKEPIRFLSEWIELYATLIRRHHIKGIPAFSRCSFAKQLQVPGIAAFQALRDEAIVGMTLWYVQGDVGYYHLGAYSERGYELQASYALFWYALSYFANKLKWLNLGGGAGIRARAADGLSRFKQGWSTGVRNVYFCGRVFNRAKYAEMVEVTGTSATDYFPAYRRGEFG